MRTELAITTVVRTPRAEPIPSLVTKSRPKNASPVTEMATVKPANSTARPAEAPASAAASCGAIPSCKKLSEARDDEERVVDSDAEPDHRHEDRRDRVDGGQTCEDEEQEERRDERREREGDRNHHRHEGAEDEEEEDDRGEHAEQLLGALLKGRELGVAVELDGDPAGGDRVADGVLDRDDRLAVLVLDHLVELRLRVADAPVVGKRAVG